MEHFKYKFIEEATDLIQDLEKSTLELNKDISNPGHIEVIFRAMHSLKGASSMFGFNKIDALTHHLESAFDKVRKGKRKVTDKLLDVTFKSVDHIKDLLAEDDQVSEETLNNHDLLLQRINSILQEEDAVAFASEITGPLTATYYIKFKPYPDIFKNGTNPSLILNELASLGKVRIKYITKDIPPFKDLNVLSCYSSWVVLLATGCQEDAIREVFMFVDLDCELIINKISNENLLDKEEFISKYEEKFNRNGVCELADVEDIIIPSLINKSLVNPEFEKPELTSKTREHNISSIRVSSEKLDELINLVSELVTRQAGLTLMAETMNNKELIAIAEDIEKISRNLRDNTFSIRLIPIDNMIIRFQRLVRELSRELNKDITFITEGTETELDKTMIEGLIDPLTHIIRNSIDHGIESTDERIRNGKPGKGKILLKAFYSGANVNMQIIDDGKGIDPVKIHNKALDLGLIQRDAILNDKDILDLIFLPGFSTAENVTKVSGRGVGMDVVKRKISELRGEVSIDSKAGKGTTITIKLPLTLSIIDGLLVMVDKSYFVIPLSSINRCLEFSHSDLVNPVNNMIYIKDCHIPFAYLRKEFGISTTPPEIEQVIVIEYGDILFGLAVDSIVGEYQAVLKSLGKMYKDQDIVSGATILGDGTVALLLDPNKIIGNFSYKMIDTPS